MWKPSDGYFTMRLDEDAVRTVTCGYPVCYATLYYGTSHRIGKIFRRYNIYEPGAETAFIREFVFKVDDKYDAEKLQEEWVKRYHTFFLRASSKLMPSSVPMNYMLKFDDRDILEIHIITDIPLDEFRKDAHQAEMVSSSDVVNDINKLCDQAIRLL